MIRNARADTFIQRTKKQYKDARNQRNLSKLNEDLHDVTRIMTRNIQDVLGRQEALNRTDCFILYIFTHTRLYIAHPCHR